MAKSKIVSLTTLKRKLSILRKERKIIAFTNGCFDILHYGHVDYLEKAKKKNRVLIVGLNSDSSVRKIKGPSRPINKQDARAALLAALECVDFVTFFTDATPQKLIEAVKPDVLIKGADWKGKGVIGGDFVKGIGGKIEFIQYLPQYSTTKTIQKILKTCK